MNINTYVSPGLSFCFPSVRCDSIITPITSLLPFSIWPATEVYKIYYRLILLHSNILLLKICHFAGEIALSDHIFIKVLNINYYVYLLLFTIAYTNLQFFIFFNNIISAFTINKCLYLHLIIYFNILS